MEELANASYENSADIVSMVEKIVLTFHPVGEKPVGIASKVKFYIGDVRNMRSVESAMGGRTSV